MKLNKIISLWLTSFAICMLGILVSHMVFYHLYYTEWHHAICERGLSKWGFYDCYYIRLMLKFIWCLFEEPYNVLKYFHVESRHIISTLIITPIVEELAFRLPLIYVAKQKNFRLFILASILSTSVFLLGHNVPFSTMIGTATAAIMFVRLAYLTKKIWPGMLLHSAYNTFIMYWTIGT